MRSNLLPCPVFILRITKHENASTMGTVPNVPTYPKGQDSPVETIRTSTRGSCEETGTSSN